MITKQKVKDYAKELGFNSSQDFMDSLTNELEAMVKKAAERAESNGRKTLKGPDV